MTLTNTGKRIQSTNEILGQHLTKGTHFLVASNAIKMRIMS